MKVTAITQDQMIIVDGVVAEMSKIGGYQMTHGEWAVQYDTATGAGHIEYLDARPNQAIGENEFNARYAWLIDEHQRYQDYVKDQSA
ncbi:hypothetical protein [Vibrio spartinae]|uniref:Uncharacterized protein n=1 Tax=Vibrio spartinae TaxID=1918945 RepID=A0A1N6MBA1_9VIBR|nr:hypothetical protein [Vibrio spartinae]SIO96684.1 hypothetical protein VSP9026_04490 [Vibrio spartinae]